MSGDPIFDVLFCLFQLRSMLFGVCIRGVQHGNGDVGIEEDDFVDAVGLWVQKCVVEMLEAAGTGLERVSLDVGIVQGAFEPLGAKIALEMVRIDVVAMRHGSYYENNTE